MATKKKAAPKKSKQLSKAKSQDATAVVVREVASASAQMKAQVELLKVETLDDATQAGQMLVQLKQVLQQVEQKRKFLTGPLRESIKRIEALFKPHIDLLRQADQQLREKVLAYQAAREEQMREAQAKLLAQAARAQAAGDAETALALATESTQLGLTPRVQHVEDGAVQTKKVWSFEVEDLGKVPHEYFTLDEAKVRAAIRAGVREIPGIRIYQREQLAVFTLVPGDDE
jgi:hypothetical protein